MPNTDRRHFLRCIAASPLVYGMSGALDTLLSSDQGQGESRAKPEWLTGAMRRAAATDTPLVAFVIPDPAPSKPRRPVPVEQDPARAAAKKAFEERLRLLLQRRPEKELRVRGGAQLPGKMAGLWWTVAFDDPVSRFMVDLQLLLESPQYETKELLMEATWVCVRRKHIGAAPGENVVVLDGKGRRLAGVMVDLSAEKAFLHKVGHMLHEGPRFRRRASAAMTPQVKDAILALGNAEEERRAAARKLLAAKFDTHRAALVQARREFKHAAIQQGLRALFEHAHRTATAKGLSGPLPFGAELIDHPVYDPCPPCGMARVPTASRMMLRFLAYRPKG